MGRNEKGEQQSSVKPRCHLMPGIPVMVFLTCRPLCSEETHAWSPDELSSLHFTLLHWGEIEQMKFSLWYGLCDKYCMKSMCTSTSMYVLYICEFAVKFKNTSQTRNKCYLHSNLSLYIMCAHMNKNGTCFASLPLLVCSL